MTAPLDMPLIHSYSRAEAIADGTLAAVPENVAREAGFTAPVTLTRAAWEDCVAWDDRDNQRKGAVQDEDGRLWDVLWMASRYARRAGAGDVALFPVHRVRREGRGTMPRKVILKSVAGPGDDGELTITIMQPRED